MGDGLVARHGDGAAQRAGLLTMRLVMLAPGTSPRRWTSQWLPRFQPPGRPSAQNLSRDAVLAGGGEPFAQRGFIGAVEFGAQLGQRHGERVEPVQHRLPVGQQDVEHHVDVAGRDACRVAEAATPPATRPARRPTCPPMLISADRQRIGQVADGGHGAVVDAPDRGRPAVAPTARARLRASSSAAGAVRETGRARTAVSIEIGLGGGEPGDSLPHIGCPPTGCSPSGSPAMPRRSAAWCCRGP